MNNRQDFTNKLLKQVKLAEFITAFSISDLEEGVFFLVLGSDNYGTATTK